MESESETQVDRVDPLLEQQSLKAIVDVDDLLDRIWHRWESAFTFLTFDESSVGVWSWSTMVGKKMKKLKMQTLEVLELPKYNDLEITKVKKSTKKVVKVEKPDSFAFKDIQSDLEALMKEEVDEDMEEQTNVKKEADLEKQSNLEEVPMAAPRPPTPVALEGSPSTGTATGWAETPSLPQGWKFRFFAHLLESEFLFVLS